MIKTNLVKRTIEKIYNSNFSLCGDIERIKKDYDEQGTWHFVIDVLDIDEKSMAYMQIVSKKICVSGAWDNGIKVINHFYVDLKKYEKMGRFIDDIITHYFQNENGLNGANYQLINWQMEK